MLVFRVKHQKLFDTKNRPKECLEVWMSWPVADPLERHFLLCSVRIRLPLSCINVCDDNTTTNCSNSNNSNNNVVLISQIIAWPGGSMILRKVLVDSYL